MRARSALPIELRSCFKRGARDQPALAAPADDPVARRAGAVQEHLVEVGAARHLAQRPHLDAGLLHVDQQVGDAGVLRRVGLGAAQAEHEVGALRVAGPDLLAVDHPLVAVELRPGLAARRGRCPSPARCSPGTRASRRAPSSGPTSPSATRRRARGGSARASWCRCRAPRPGARGAGELLADHLGGQRVGGLLGAAVLACGMERAR